MISRLDYINRVQNGLRRSPVVALIGPRQCGKTTLARQVLAENSPLYFDLEDPVVAAAFENPMSSLAPLRGVVVIDEAQRCPQIFPVLRVLVDRAENPARFLILGSASPELSRQASESLAGRVEIIEMGGFHLGELAQEESHALWLRGGFPRSFLAGSELDSMEWRKQFVRTFLERDLAQLGFRMSPQVMGRFWTMISHYHGQIWNGSEIAASMGISHQTARNYLDALEQTFMVRRLLPWYVNVGKRLVKSPKIFFRDSGIFHTLQGIGSEQALIAHPKLGASWEGFALEQILSNLRSEEAYFYAIHGGSDLDLYMPKHRLGLEIKRRDAPRKSRSMEIAMCDLGLEKLIVVYPGTRSYELGEQVHAIPLGDVVSSLGSSQPFANFS
jgi:predicted AAA+ superfamily ATPase